MASLPSAMTPPPNMWSRMRSSFMPGIFLRVFQSSPLPAAINLTVTFFLSPDRQLSAEAIMGLAKTGAAIMTSLLAFLRTSSSLATDGLLAVKNEYVGALDEFAFLVKRLQRLRHCLLPTLYLSSSRCFVNAVASRGEQVILEGAGLAAFYPAFLLKRIQNLVDFASRALWLRG